MESNISIRKCRERIVWCMALVTIIFVVASLGYEFITHYKTSNITTVMLEDASSADVLVILSEAYNERQWIRLVAIIHLEASKSHDIEYLNSHIQERLIELGHPIVAFSIDRKKNVIYKNEGAESP